MLMSKRDTHAIVYTELVAKVCFCYLRVKNTERCAKFLKHICKYLKKQLPVK